MNHRNYPRGRQSTAQRAQVKQSEAFEMDEEDEDIWVTRMPSSVRRYQGLADVRSEVGRVQADVEALPTMRATRSGLTGQHSAIPARRSATQANIPAVQINRQTPISPHNSGDLEDEGGKRSLHWLVFAGMAMLTMIVGWVLLSMVANWWQVTQDDWHYGRPRTYQTDAVVGHSDTQANPSHFIVLNQNRHVEVIEFPGGDPTKARIFLGPTLTGQGQDLTPVTITFKDVNGDGKVDMILNIQDSRFVFINENGTFRPAHSGENIQL